MYYTKYRPEKFADIIKPNVEVESILNQIIKSTVAHAYILSGSRGIGKTSTARLIAKGVNCLKFNGDVCGECENCLAIKNGSFVDVIEIDGASNRGIEEARSLRESLKFAPLKGRKKVYIIDEVHMLTTEAFNALLKAIEEPPVYVMFILCTTEVHKIPETIKSRCQLFILKRPSNNQIISKLKKIVDSEGLQISEDLLNEVAIQSNGGFRDAETLLTQLQNNPNLSLNIDSTDSKLDFLEKSLQGNAGYLIEYIGNLEKNGVNIVNWLASYLTLVRNVLHIKLDIKKSNPYFNETQIQKISNFIVDVETGSIVSHLNSFIEIYSKIRYSQTPELVFEVLLLNNFIQFETPKKIIYPIKTGHLTKKKEGTESNPTSSKIEAEVAQNLTKAYVFEPKITPEEVIDEVIVIEEGEDFVEEASISIHEVKQKWLDVIKTASTENKTIETLLRVIRPRSTNNDIITFEVDFKFHAERLDNNKNKLIIEKILYSVFGQKLLYKCVIENKRVINGFNEGEVQNLTDYNVAPPKDLSPDDVLSIFDGGVPIKG
jgi:DNA polymerase-3 subunit gamma/tau